MTENISEIVKKQRAFFRGGPTLSLKFRQMALNRLEKSIKKNKKKIEQALKQDLNKAASETYMTETGMVLSELAFVQRHLAGWMKEKKVPTPMAQFHGKSFIRTEPYGVVLIMSPWNYPLMLCLEPLIDAIAAGNCAIVKPSAYAPAASAILKRLIEEVFPPHYIAVIEGGREENIRLLEQKFDYIFFTGSVEVGKLVMEKAAAHLTPVTLELGGKSPCIVDETADLPRAARRIVFGKLLNSGQTCVAPDYLVVHKNIKESLLKLLQKEIHKMLGKEPLASPDYPRMINQKHFDRVMGLIQAGHVREGGYGNRETLQIAPTILEPVRFQEAVMQEEIFGPVLPVLTFEKKEELPGLLRQFGKPLALYLFTRDKRMEREILSRISFGGGCVNDTIIHLASSRLGFGGVGESGMGSYHGKIGFETFSHQKSIVKKYNWIDLPFRYHPYTKWKEKSIRLFLR